MPAFRYKLFLSTTPKIVPLLSFFNLCIFLCMLFYLQVSNRRKSNRSLLCGVTSSILFCVSFSSRHDKENSRENSANLDYLYSHRYIMPMRYVGCWFQRCACLCSSNHKAESTTLVLLIPLISFSIPITHDWSYCSIDLCALRTREDNIVLEMSTSIIVSHRGKQN